MANELTVSASLKFVKGEASVSVGKAGVQLDVSGTDYVTRTQNVGTSEEALGIGDIGTPGYIFIRNLDSTNFVEIRPATGAADLVKVSPGGIALFELAASAPYVIADTAACQIEYTLIEA